MCTSLMRDILARMGSGKLPRNELPSQRFVVKTVSFRIPVDTWCLVWKAQAHQLCSLVNWLVKGRTVERSAPFLMPEPYFGTAAAARIAYNPYWGRGFLRPPSPPVLVDLPRCPTPARIRMRLCRGWNLASGPIGLVPSTTA